MHWLHQLSNIVASRHQMMIILKYKKLKLLSYFWCTLLISMKNSTRNIKKYSFAMIETRRQTFSVHSLNISPSLCSDCMWQWANSFHMLQILQAEDIQIWIIWDLLFRLNAWLTTIILGQWNVIIGKRLKDIMFNDKLKIL